ncbi:hypothetical protein NITMOv2_1593 [Nitrospira moscoviensis]|uniref:Uncharacterized protein n=1 Tax=Nitrospira moscoviensis TaxID=42253 RepID=A0A0K2GBQ1_NITMO|nr:hypothetical protein NITMOv2_1593 [Nitrospira moscoviensis]
MMFRRGTGLIAGPPISRPKPALVTVATPTPPLISIPGSVRSSTSAINSAPCVQSGSSPASLITLQIARVSTRSHRARAKVTRVRFGSVVSMSDSMVLLTRQRVAALAAAAAQAPVVYPVRKPFRLFGGTLLLIAHLSVHSTRRSKHARRLAARSRL